MIKQKLIKKRIERGFSQKEMAHELDMEQSQYSRRENGTIRISKKEWDKLAKILNVEFAEIYEPHDGIVHMISSDNVNNGEYSGSQNHFHNLPDHVLETMRKYIERLEEENERLRDKGKEGN